MSFYRAEVVGSLLRPQYLTDARAARESGSVSEADFKRIEDRAVDQAIALQEGAGIDVVNDGEMRRTFFFDQLVAGLSGLAPIESTQLVHFLGDKPEDDFELPVAIAVTEKVQVRPSPAAEEYVYLRARAGVPVKVTLPSPLLMWEFWTKEDSSDAYPDPFELLADVAEIINGWAKDLQKLGCEYIQFDAPELLQAHVDDDAIAKLKERGIPTERVATEGFDLLNAAADVPGARCGLHLCRGNYKSRWLAAGGYEKIAREVFGRASNFDVFYLEYDDERSGSFEPLADLPDDKVAVLGLVSTKRDEMEEAESLIKRIDEASKFHPRDQLAISPQCGFASGATGGNEISETTQAAKLGLVAEVAQRVWG